MRFVNPQACTDAPAVTSRYVFLDGLYISCHMVHIRKKLLVICRCTKAEGGGQGRLWP